MIRIFPPWHPIGQCGTRECTYRRHNRVQEVVRELFIDTGDSDFPVDDL